jgi:hypothetical protein
MFVSAIILGAKLAEVNLTQKTFDEILTDLKLKPDGNHLFDEPMLRLR